MPDGTFLVAYQNPCGACPTPGEIDQFHRDGTFQRALVPATDAAGNPNPDAPFAPHAMILGPDNRTLYVSDYGLTDIGGAVERYDVVTGKLLGKLNFDSFINSSASEGEFHPRGLVFAPDRRTLYLSLFSFKDFAHKGWILTYDIKNGDVRLLAGYNPNAAPTDCHRYLHRPDGMAIGRNQDLYVIGRSPGDDGSTDKVLVFNRNTGKCRPWVDLDQPGTSTRTYARSLLFGPRGKLYVPMTVAAEPAGTDAGAVRAYDLHTFPVTYTEFVAPNPDVSWDYLTFGKTDPTTLAYHQRAERAHR